MSRIPLILVGADRRRPARSASRESLDRGRRSPGVAAIVQPWTLLAGGSNLVPDGLTSMAVVAGVLRGDASQ